MVYCLLFPALVLFSASIFIHSYRSNWFNCCVIFHVRTIPAFAYPFSSWRLFVLLPDFCHYEKCCNECPSTCFSMCPFMYASLVWTEHIKCIGRSGIVVNRRFREHIHFSLHCCPVSADGEWGWKSQYQNYPQTTHYQPRHFYTLPHQPLLLVKEAQTPSGNHCFSETRF